MTDPTALLESAEAALGENNPAEARELLRRGADNSGAPLDIFLRLMSSEIEEIIAHRRDLKGRFRDGFWHAHAFSHVLSLFRRKGAVHACTEALKLATDEDQRLRGTLSRIRAGVRTSEYHHLVHDFETLWSMTSEPRLIGLRQTAVRDVSTSTDPRIAGPIDAVLAQSFLNDAEQAVLRTKKDELDALEFLAKSSKG